MFISFAVIGLWISDLFRFFINVTFPITLPAGGVVFRGIPIVTEAAKTAAVRAGDSLDGHICDD